MKVLIVGSYDERRNGAMFYSTTRKLANGLVRAGCDVFGFSDREILRADSPLRLKPIGRQRMNRRLLETVENFRPALILLCHADTVARETLRLIRERPDPPVIALRNLDPVYVPKNEANIRRYEDLVDAIFLTTAGAETLGRFSGPGRVVAFMPNPIDPSIETGRAFDDPAPAHDLFFAARVNLHTDRLAVFDALRAKLPDLRVDLHGFSGRPPLFGTAFFEAMTRCRMGWSLSLKAYAPLYASDRMAQYLGNGLLTLIDRATGFDRIFAEDEIGFYDDIDDLAARIRAYVADDALARSVAARGHAKAHAVFDCTRVARWIVETSMRQPPSQDWGWPMDLH